MAERLHPRFFHDIMLCSSSSTLLSDTMQDAGNAASHQASAHTGDESLAPASFAAVEDAGATPLPSGTALQNGALLLGAVLGRGGFGITYLGRDVSRRRYVAIKEFFPAGCARRGRQVQPAGAMSADSYAAARHIFLGEARALARFEHPGIVAGHGVFEENNTAYLVMEYLQGKTLHELAAAALSEREALGYIRQVAAALEVLHHSGVIHRDINPANVIVCDEEMRAPRKAPADKAQGTGAQRRAVVVDFGLNYRVEAAGVLDTRLLAEPPPLGTPGYAPLEQYTRRGRCGPATDIYALGATLYFLLTGHAPPEAMERAHGQMLAPPRRLNPKISDTTSAAIEWAMEMQSDDRPQSVRAFLDALAGAAAPVRRQRDAGLPPGATPVTAPLTAATVSAAAVRDASVANAASPVAASPVAASPAAARLAARSARRQAAFSRSQRGRAVGASGSATRGARPLLPTLSLAAGVGAALAACALWLSPLGMHFGIPPRESNAGPSQVVMSQGPAHIARSVQTPAPPSRRSAQPPGVPSPATLSPLMQPPITQSPPSSPSRVVRRRAEPEEMEPAARSSDGGKATRDVSTGRSAQRMALVPRASRLSTRAATASAGTRSAEDAIATEEVMATPQRRERREPVKRRRRERIVSSFVEQAERPVIRATRPRRRREAARAITVDRPRRTVRRVRIERQVPEAGLPPAPMAEAGLPPS